MKIAVLRSVLIMGVCLVCWHSPVTAADEKKTEKMKTGDNVQLGVLATELIGVYGRPQKVSERRAPAVLRPPALSTQHLEPKYRLAWEQLLNALIAEPTREINFMGDRIVEALWRMADPESVQALIRTFEKTVSKNAKQKDIIHRQEHILQALVSICDTNALEAILLSLDTADEAYRDQEPVTTAEGLTLREKTYRLMLQPDNPGKSDAQKKGIEKAKNWKSVLNGYDRTKLSKKNRELLDKAKSFKREKPSN